VRYRDVRPDPLDVLVGAHELIDPAATSARSSVHHLGWATDYEEASATCRACRRHGATVPRADRLSDPGVRIPHVRVRHADEASRFSAGTPGARSPVGLRAPTPTASG